jgi:hypothetical protein
MRLHEGQHSLQLQDAVQAARVRFSRLLPFNALLVRSITCVTAIPVVRMIWKWRSAVAVAKCSAALDTPLTKLARPTKYA